jgi:PPOX class probable F420-dependent enzyme
MAAVDFSSGIGPRVLNQLRDEQVAWLTTSSSDGTPQPRLIWFLWEDDKVLFYSQPEAAKMAHIARNPHASLHFNSDPYGNEMSVMTGTATVDHATPTMIDHADYMTKYHDAFIAMELAPEEASASYSVPVRFQIGKIRGL